MVFVIKKCATCGREFVARWRKGKTSAARPNQKYWFCCKKCYNEGRKIYDFYKEQSRKAREKANESIRAIWKDPVKAWKLLEQREKTRSENARIKLKQKQIKEFGRKKAHKQKLEKI